MVNKKLYRMFVEGKVNQGLVDAWVKNHESYQEMDESAKIDLPKYLDKMSSGILIFFVGLIFIFTLICVSVLPLKIISGLVCLGLSCGAIAMMVWGTTTAFRTDYGGQLIEDLETLNKYIGFCGNRSSTELNKISREQLVDTARQIIDLEIDAKNCMNSDSGNNVEMCKSRIVYAENIRNKRFSPQHTIFLRFGLVEEKWDSYFDVDKLPNKTD